MSEIKQDTSKKERHCICRRFISDMGTYAMHPDKNCPVHSEDTHIMHKQKEDQLDNNPVDHADDMT